MRKVDSKCAAREAVSVALDESGAVVLELVGAGVAAGRCFPGRAGAYSFGALPTSVVPFLGHALSHESHHRGQAVSLAWNLGDRLPKQVSAGLWQPKATVTPRETSDTTAAVPRGRGMMSVTERQPRKGFTGAATSGEFSGRAR